MKKEVNMTPREQYDSVELLKEILSLNDLTTTTRIRGIYNGIDHNQALAKLEVCENKIRHFLTGK